MSKNLKAALITAGLFGAVGTIMALCAVFNSAIPFMAVIVAGLMVVVFVGVRDCLD